MMRQLVRSRFAALALVLQVLAVFGTARGLVVCVGAAGHVAVEDPEASARCRAAQTALSVPVPDAPGFSAPAACVDTPVMTAATDRGPSVVRSDTAALAAAAPVADAPHPELRPDRMRFWVDPPDARTRILRSIVLLI